MIGNEDWINNIQERLFEGNLYHNKEVERSVSNYSQSLGFEIKKDSLEDKPRPKTNNRAKVKRRKKANKTHRK